MVLNDCEIFKKVMDEVDQHNDSESMVSMVAFWRDGDLIVIVKKLDSTVVYSCDGDGDVKRGWLCPDILKAMLDIGELINGELTSVGAIIFG
jgi:hypothetical protein